MVKCKNTQSSLCDDGAVCVCVFSWGGGSLWLSSTPEGQNAEGARLIINVRMAGLQKTQPKIKEMRLIHPPVFNEVPPCMGG